ncbi:MAG: alpha/beta hydrolase family protein [Gammaproteobacteria bacterium]
MEALSSAVSRVANETYGHSRRIMPEQPWWDNLEPSFHKFPDDFYLDLRTQLMVDATAGVDLLLRTGVASALSLLALPLSVNPMRLKEDNKERRFYEELADRGDPSVFFRPPSRKVTMRESDPGAIAFRPEGGRCRLLSFESPFETVNPRMNTRYQSLKRNRTAWAQYWQHGDGPRPTIVVVHGFLADPYWVNSRFLALPWFYKQGYDILLYTLPHHGRRRELTAPFSGHGYFSHGVSHINETVAQSIHDLRIFLDWLKENGAPQVGITGISLGGYTTALAASVFDDLAFAIPNVPVISLVDLIFQWFPAGPMIKTGLRLTNISVRDARHAMAAHCPLTYQPKLPKERLMIIGGAGDRLAPPKHTRLLWDHWNRCRIHWFPGNHVIHLDQGKYLKEMLSFMKSVGFD